MRRWLVVALVVVSTRASAAPDKARCQASYEAAQVLRREEKLDAARSEVRICLDTCPEALVHDCTAWLAELSALAPTIRVAIRDERGNAIPAARLYVDGRPATLTDDGAVAVDPGAHRLRGEAPRFVAREAQVDVHVGERGRAVDLVLAAPAVVDHEARPRETRGGRGPSYVIGGIGAAALLAGGVLAIKGEVDRAELRSSCAPHCNDSNVRAIRTTWWVAAGLAVGGAAAVGIAVVLWPSSRSPARIAMGPFGAGVDVAF